MFDIISKLENELRDAQDEGKSLSSHPKNDGRAVALDKKIHETRRALGALYREQYGATA